MRSLIRRVIELLALALLGMLLLSPALGWPGPLPSAEGGGAGPFGQGRLAGWGIMAG
jgi:hypothetical protein